MDYKETVYHSYRSAFKGDAAPGRIRFIAGKIIPIIKPWVGDIDKNLPAADLGCGAGELLYALRELGFNNLSGCDWSNEQVLMAQREFPEVVKADLFDFLSASDDNHFILISLFDLIEHLSRQRSFDLFQLVYKKLRPGGVLIAHTPNGISPFAGQVFWGDITHEWCLTPSSAANLCGVHGFTDFEATGHLGAGKGIPGIIRRLLWSIFKALLRLGNAIETGSLGGNIWTRNFAFKAVKPKIAVVITASM